VANYTKAQLATQSGNAEAAKPAYLKAAEHLKKLRAAHPKLNDNEKRLLAPVLYDEACVEALNGKVDKAVAALTDAVDSGYSDMEHVKKDSDFDGIRKDPKFAAAMKELTAKMEQNQAAEVARLVESTRKLLAAQKPFDFDFSLPDLDGKTVAKKDFADKVLIVDFWGTWCPPCRMEVPHFVALHQKYKKDGLEIVGINYERVAPAQVKQVVGKFVKENKVSYPCLIGDPATQRKVPDLNAYPTTLFFDRTGKLRLRVVGYKPLPELEAIVKVLLDEKRTARARE
jgi:thiol-disulfide isomerase/thioredoxin